MSTIVVVTSFDLSDTKGQTKEFRSAPTLFWKYELELAVNELLGEDMNCSSEFLNGFVRYLKRLAEAGLTGDITAHDSEVRHYEYDFELRDGKVYDCTGSGEPRLYT